MLFQMVWRIYRGAIKKPRMKFLNVCRNRKPEIFCRSCLAPLVLTFLMPLPNQVFYQRGGRCKVLEEDETVQCSAERLAGWQGRKEQERSRRYQQTDFCSSQTSRRPRLKWTSFCKTMTFAATASMSMWQRSPVGGCAELIRSIWPQKREIGTWFACSSASEQTPLCVTAVEGRPMTTWDHCEHNKNSSAADFLDFRLYSVGLRMGV